MKVVIAGGGIVGAATAWHVLSAEPSVEVTIVEPDPGHARAATPRSSGGVRQLFSRPENIALSRYTHELIARWPQLVGADAPDLLWEPAGYLFLAERGPATDRLAANLDIQRANGVEAEWLSPDRLAARFAGVATGDLGGAVLSTTDGWLDPSALLAGTLGAARKLGARLRRDRVVGFDVAGSRLRAAELASGGRLAADAFVNAAGCWAPELASRAGMPVPVEPMLRLEHHVHGPDEPTGLPFVKDQAGLAVRPVRTGLSASVVDHAAPGGFDRPVDHGYFDRVVWPALVHRFPGLDRLRLDVTSVGHYDQNRLDGNVIVGNWPRRVDNLYLACGFSGHGLMHAHGIGRALGELLLHGEYRTIDLDRLGYRRVVEDRPYPELGVR